MSIFREKRIDRNKVKSEKELNNLKSIFINKTHDQGIPRARKYTLSCNLYFTEYSGYTIKELIETSFNYFTWLPRNIKNFTYDEKVINYAKNCLKFLEKIDKHSVNNSQTELDVAINQVDAMIKYENCLDYEKNESIILYHKMMVNTEYYKKIINTPLERLIRQSRDLYQVSSFYRRKYFEEIIKDIS